MHAHTHIVDYNFKDEEKLIKDLKFEKVEFEKIRNIKCNYIFYLNGNDENYISLEFPSISQLMRIKIAEELDIKNKYDWRKNDFKENIDITINNFKKYRRK